MFIGHVAVVLQVGRALFSGRGRVACSVREGRALFSGQVARSIAGGKSLVRRLQVSKIQSK